MNIHFVTDEKIAETSSKGNQEKWKDGNRWYKLDQFGYEALAESAVSCFLEQSNIETDNPFTSDFLKLLKKQEDEVTVFSDGLWTGLLDYTTVYADGRMTFTFKNGQTIDG